MRATNIYAGFYAAVLAVGTLLAGGASGVSVRAQHDTAADIDDGGRVFRDTCANCHGPDGNEVAGIDLGRGVFRRASSDQDLIQIIRTGIPGTAMPATNFSEAQAAQVVAYLRSVAASRRSASGNGVTDRGRTVFEGKGACATCHRVNAIGGRLGPDLTNIGQLRRAAELEASVIDPGAEILAPNRTYRVVTREGVETKGRLLNLDSFTVQMLDTKEQLRSFEKARLRDYGFVDASPMPSYRDKLSAQELADLVSYLVSLKGRATP
jgi:putative heme-binding domain-containing protein